MAVREIKPDIFSVGAIDWDRRLFDELIPLPDGTSYNSYLIKSNEKITLIDTVDPTKTYELIDNLKKLNITNIVMLLPIMLNRTIQGPYRKSWSFIQMLKL